MIEEQKDFKLIQARFEKLKNELMAILDSNELTYETMLVKYVHPEELLRKGFLFQFLHRMNPPDNPLPYEAIENFFECFFFDFKFADKLNKTTYLSLKKPKLVIIAVMKYLENELYLFLKSKKSIGINYDPNTTDPIRRVWKLKEWYDDSFL
ncbi:MAG: hypothetical protein N2490_07610 [Ignavibacteria bacterium]|nr:hypothetical protein [Ignavibacteria bacterium]